MPSLLARLGPVTAPGQREILARKGKMFHAMAAELLALPDDAVVLLNGPGPPWQSGKVVRPRSWPLDLPLVEEVWAAKAETRRERVGPRVRTQGWWTLDPRGVAFELGFGHAGELVVYVLNYAGWRISDFPREPIEVAVCRLPVGEVWIVTPAAVPVPAPESIVDPPRALLPDARVHEASSPSARTWTDRGAVEGFFVRPASSPPSATRVSRVFRFIELSFSDGWVSFPMGLGRGRLACESAREVHNDVRDILDEELPGGVKVAGVVHPDGVFIGEARGLDRLADLFERALFKQFVRQSVAAHEWLDAEELASRRPGGGGRREPTDLLAIDAFGFGPRADAFRRLFAHRDPSERVRMLPGRALVIPLPPSDGGARWYAWETVEDDHATYLFRPRTTGARDRMLAWTQAPGARRRELLNDKELRTELGFVRTVVHRDAGGHQLGRWWAHLCAAIGLRDGA